MAIDLEKHKVYVDSLKMDMVPYSIAVQAVQEVNGIDAEKYAQELDNALKELQNSLNNLKLDD
jgi:hypothetical protein